MQQRFFIYLFKVILILTIPLLAFQNRTSIKANNANSSEKNIEWYLKEKKRLSKNEQYEQAIELLTKAQQQFKEEQSWRAYIICGIEKSKLADNTSDEDKKNFAFPTLQLAQQHLAKNDSLLGKAYQQVAEVNILYEKYDSSLIHFEKALPILKVNKKWEDLAWATITNGVNHYYLDDIDAFKSSMNEAEALYKKHQLPQAVYINILELRGAVYSIEGDYELALKNMYQSIHFYQQKKKLSKPDKHTTANTYHNISMTYISKGAYNKAIDYQYKALKLYHEIDDKMEYANALSGLAVSYWSKQEFRKTIDLNQRALQIAQDLQKKDQQKIFRTTYVDLGQAYKAIEEYDSSLYYLNAAKQLDNKHTKTFAWIQYGLLLNKLGQPQKAIKAFMEAEKYARLSYEKHSNLYKGLAYSYTQLNDFDNALKNIQKGLTINASNFTDTLNYYANPTLENINEPVFFLQTIEAKAYCLSQFKENPKNLEAALATYELTLDWLDTMRQSYAYEDSKIVVNTRNRRKYEQAIDVAYQLYERTNDTKYIDKAFIFAEKIKSNVLMANIQANDKQSVIPQQLKQREKDLAMDVAFYERELYKAKEEDAPRKIKMYQNELTNNRIALSELKDTLKKAYPKYYNLQYSPELATIQSIQASLKKKDNQGLISYFSGDSTTYAFTITANTVDLVRVENTNLINQEITAFRKELNQPDITPTTKTFIDYNKISYQLFETIVEPTIKTLTNTTKQLTIIPDGSLSYIPFEILTNKINSTPSQDFSQMPYLLYKYQINYGYSSTLLRENQKRYQEVASNTNCLAYAPIYQNSGLIAGRGTQRTLRGSLSNLKGTLEEIQAVGQYFEGEFNQGETATKQRFIEEASDFGILHLAMHGEANFEHEKMANLKFANSDATPNEENLMYHSDIVHLDLNAQLVVLSACETGLGKYIYGEGIASLGRSFMYAGVPSVVMSLWKVDDQSTSQLMPYFYKNLSEGKSKDKALHDAKLEYLQTADFANLHPHYWAGFVTIGDNQPIKQKNNTIFWIIGSLLVFCLFGTWLWRKKLK